MEGFGLRVFDGGGGAAAVEAGAGAGAAVVAGVGSGAGEGVASAAAGAGTAAGVGSAVAVAVVVLGVGLTGYPGTSPGLGLRATGGAREIDLGTTGGASPFPGRLFMSPRKGFTLTTPGGWKLVSEWLRLCLSVVIAGSAGAASSSASSGISASTFRLGEDVEWARVEGGAMSEGGENVGSGGMGMGDCWLGTGEEDEEPPGMTVARMFWSVLAKGFDLSTPGAEPFRALGRVDESVWLLSAGGGSFGLLGSGGRTGKGMLPIDCRPSLDESLGMEVRGGRTMMGAMPCSFFRMLEGVSSSFSSSPGSVLVSSSWSPPNTETCSLMTSNHSFFEAASEKEAT